MAVRIISIVVFGIIIVNDDTVAFNVAILNIKVLLYNYL